MISPFKAMAKLIDHSPRRLDVDLSRSHLQDFPKLTLE
jgi:hypothetical protein